MDGRGIAPLEGCHVEKNAKDRNFIAGVCQIVTKKATRKRCKIAQTQFHCHLSCFSFLAPCQLASKTAGLDAWEHPRAKT